MLNRSREGTEESEELTDRGARMSKRRDFLLRVVREFLRNGWKTKKASNSSLDIS